MKQHLFLTSAAQVYSFNLMRWVFPLSAALLMMQILYLQHRFLSKWVRQQIGFTSWTGRQCGLYDKTTHASECGGCSPPQLRRFTLVTAEYGSPNGSHETTTSSTLEWVTFTSESVHFHVFDLQEVGPGCRIPSYQQTFSLSQSTEHIQHSCRDAFY